MFLIWWVFKIKDIGLDKFSDMDIIFFLVYVYFEYLMWNFNDILLFSMIREWKGG